MFTGLIEQQGRVIANELVNEARRLIVMSNFEQVQVGESIAVDGVCLTALPMSRSEVYFDLSPETLQTTTLGRLVVDDTVHLERAMSAATRFGGHYVSGHVDTTVLVHSIKAIGEYIEMKLSGFPAHAKFYLIPKGSITVAGVSLTINEVDADSIKLMLVPHTLAQTHLGTLSIGCQVNIEFDYLTRIVAHQLQLAGKLNPEVSP